MSAVDPASDRSTLLDHVQRIRNLERAGSVWITVGTAGMDGVDALLSSSSPPFKNGWTNALGTEFPVAFTLVNGWVHLRGGFVGGSASTVVFTLPPGYRPGSRQPYLIPTSSISHYATGYIEPTGDVVFGTVI